MSEKAENKAGSYHIPQEKVKFDPDFTMLYDSRRYKMGRNQSAINEQTAATTDQVVCITQIINDYEQRIRELEDTVAQMQKDAKVVTNNKPDTPKRGRPKKEEASE